MSSTFGGDLLERGLGHRDLISGGVGAGVARPQLARERLAGLVEVAEQRVKAKPPLKVPVAPSFSEWAPISV